MAAAELAAIPGWLLRRRPGPAGRPGAARPGRERGRAAGRGSTSIHRGVVALDAELDALDGARKTESIFLFLEWSRWLESVPDAATLLDQLSPDPRRRFLGSGAGDDRSRPPSGCST